MHYKRKERGKLTSAFAVHNIQVSSIFGMLNVYQSTLFGKIGHQQLVLLTINGYIYIYHFVSDQADKTYLPQIPVSVSLLPAKVTKA